MGQFLSNGTPVNVLNSYDYVSQEFGCTADTDEVPVPTSICSSGFMHTGVDLAASLGQQVFAARSGRVIQVGYNGPDPDVGTDFGPDAVVIRTADGRYNHYYGHLSTALVSVGQPVLYHTPIGLVGTFGVSTGPHLHFEVQPYFSAAFNYRTVIDPVPFITTPEIGDDELPLYLIQGNDTGKVYVCDGMKKWWIPDPNSLNDVTTVFTSIITNNGNPFKVGSDTENAIPNA